MILGITGATGSGKSTLAGQILSTLGTEKVSVINQDHYYLPLQKQQKDQQGWPVFDRPGALDLELFAHHLRRLKAGGEIQVREYTFNVPGRMGRIFRVAPSSLVLVEGLFLLCHKPIRDLLDHCLYLHVPPEVRMQRRFIRDQAERNMQRAEMEYRWKNHVLPAEKQWLEPFCHMAELVGEEQLTDPFNRISVFKQIVQEI